VDFTFRHSGACGIHALFELAPTLKLNAGERGTTNFHFA
jgi:hypothetical protein